MTPFINIFSFGQRLNTFVKIAGIFSQLVDFVESKHLIRLEISSAAADISHRSSSWKPGCGWLSVLY